MVKKAIRSMAGWEGLVWGGHCLSSPAFPLSRGLGENKIAFADLTKQEGSTPREGVSGTGTQITSVTFVVP